MKHNYPKEQENPNTAHEQLSAMFYKLNAKQQPITLGDVMDLKSALMRECPTIFPHPSCTCPTNQETPGPTQDKFVEACKTCGHINGHHLYDCSAPTATPEQKDFVEGKPTMNEKYDAFIKNGLASGFSDDQINFLWDWFGDDIPIIEEE